MYAIILVSVMVIGQAENAPPGARPVDFESLKSRLDPVNITSVRMSALVEAAQIGPEAAVILPLLMSNLDDNDVELRSQAVISVGRVGPQAQDAAPRLVRMLDGDASGTVRAVAARSLGQIAVRDDAVLESLRAALTRDSHSTVRVYAAESLGRLSDGSMRTVTALAQATGDPWPGVRAAAIRSLGAIQKHPDRAVPALVRGLTDPDSRYESWSAHLVGSKPVAADAAGALGMFGKDATRAVPRLRSLMGQAESSRVRVAAAVALIRIEGAGDEYIAALREALAELESSTFEHQLAKRDAAAGLALLGSPPGEVIDSLGQALSDESWMVRVAAARALGEMGQHGSGALAALQARVTDCQEEEVVRQAAGDATRRIQDAMRKVK